VQLFEEDKSTMSHGPQSDAFFYGAVLSATASVLHMAIIAGGAKWYQFFGAGKKFVTAAEKGHGWHDVVTLGIAIMLALWAAYALSVLDFGVPQLPAAKIVLSIITAAYMLRGIAGFALLLAPRRSLSTRFIVVSSLICLGIGAVHSVGLWELLTVEF
jgi:uncharacterized membrane protein